MYKITVIAQNDELAFWKNQFESKIHDTLDIKFSLQLEGIGKTDLLILDYSGRENAKDLLVKIAPGLIGKNIIIASDHKDADLAIEAIKLGALGFLVKPFQDVEFQPILYKINQLVENKKEHGDMNGKVITLFSYKGGTGVSTVAVNLAYALSMSGKKTLLIDGAGFSNHLTVLLNVPPKCTIVDICKQGEQVDETYLTNATKMVNENLGIIGGLLKAEDLGYINVKYINKLLDVSTDMYDYVVVDASTHSVDELAMTLVQAASELLLVTTFDLLSVKDNRFFIQVLKELGMESERIKPIINRQDWFIGSLEPEIIHKQLNHPVYHALPNDWNLCVEATNYGRPVLEFAPQSQLAKSYLDLANLIMGKVSQKDLQNNGNVHHGDKKNKSMFGGFFGSKNS